MVRSIEGEQLLHRQIAVFAEKKGFHGVPGLRFVIFFTGIDDPYEAPAKAELVLNTAKVSIAEAVAILLDALEKGGALKA